MRRRDFISFVCGGISLWPRKGRAQLAANGPRRVGVLMGLEAEDPEVPPRKLALEDGLRKLGWSIPGTVQIEYRFAAADPQRMQTYARELIELPSDVIVGHNTRPVEAIMRLTHSVPVVFIAVADPMGSGFVANLAHPGGNATGFINHDQGMGGKWLEFLKEIAPQTSKATLVYNPVTAPGAGSYFESSFTRAGQSLGVAITQSPVHSVAEIATTFMALADTPGYGVVVMPDTFTTVNRDGSLRLRHGIAYPRYTHGVTSPP